MWSGPIWTTSRQTSITHGVAAAGRRPSVQGNHRSLEKKGSGNHTQRLGLVWMCGAVWQCGAQDQSMTSSRSTGLQGELGAHPRTVLPHTLLNPPNLIQLCGISSKCGVWLCYSPLSALSLTVWTDTRMWSSLFSARQSGRTC